MARATRSKRATGRAHLGAWAVAGAIACGLAPAAAPAATRCVPSAEPGVERCTTGLSAGLQGRLPQLQRASNWCWAATVSIVLGRYGLRVAQEDVVRARFGSAVNLGLPAQDLPALLTRTWRDDRGRTLEASAQPLPSWRMAQGLLAPEVLEDLDGERPLIVGALRHAVVLVEVAYERRADAPPRLLGATVLDPAEGAGLRALRPQEAQPAYLARVQVTGGEDLRVAQGGEMVVR